MPGAPGALSDSPNRGRSGGSSFIRRTPTSSTLTALGHLFGRNRERGVYRSKDGGTTWEQVLYLNDSTGASDLAMNPRNPRVLYAGMWRAERKPWTMISGGGDGGVYKSVDAGDTWTKLAGGLPTGIVGKVGVTVSPANPDRVWALVEAEPDGGLYRSDDAGKTWTRINKENRIRQRAWYYTRVEADPQDEYTVYVMNTSIYRSIDGGKSFTEIQVPHGDTHDLWINPRAPKTMIIGDDGGAQVTLNGGKTWSSMNNQPTAEFYDVAVDNQFPYRVYSAQQDNTTISVPSWMGPNVLHPMNAWEYAAGCETGPVALHPDHPDIVWGGCYGGAINRLDKKSDQRRNVVLYPQLQLGQAAKDLKYRFQWVAPIVVSRHDPNVVYHGSQYVHRTRDGGMTWETISPDLTTNTPAHQQASGGPINNDVTGVEIFNTIFQIAEDPEDAKTLWTGSDDGRVHITRDGGASWQDITPSGFPQFGTVERHRSLADAPGARLPRGAALSPGRLQAVHLPHRRLRKALDAGHRREQRDPGQLSGARGARRSGAPGARLRRDRVRPLRLVRRRRALAAVAAQPPDLAGRRPAGARHRPGRRDAGTCALRSSTTSPRSTSSPRWRAPAARTSSRRATPIARRWAAEEPVEWRTPPIRSRWGRCSNSGLLPLPTRRRTWTSSTRGARWFGASPPTPRAPGASGSPRSSRRPARSAWCGT